MKSHYVLLEEAVISETQLDSSELQVSFEKKSELEKVVVIHSG